jgi:hypothetical protein
MLLAGIQKSVIAAHGPLNLPEKHFASDAFPVTELDDRLSGSALRLYIFDDEIQGRVREDEVQVCDCLRHIGFVSRFADSSDSKMHFSGNERE